MSRKHFSVGGAGRAKNVVKTKNIPVDVLPEKPKISLQDLIDLVQRRWEPREDRVIIYQDEAETNFKGTKLIKAEAFMTKPSAGTICAVGPGLRNEKGWLWLIYRLLIWLFVPGTNRLGLGSPIGAQQDLPDMFEKGMSSAMEGLEVGDRCLFGKFAGTEVDIDGYQFIIVRQTDIFMREKKVVDLKDQPVLNQGE